MKEDTIAELFGLFFMFVGFIKIMFNDPINDAMVWMLAGFVMIMYSIHLDKEHNRGRTLKGWRLRHETNNKK